MHEVLRQRLIRRIESLPEEQVYQVLDYIEFLESKYSGNLGDETSGLQRFAEGLEDRIRKKAMNPATLREAFQLISAADRVLQSVSTAGRQMLDDLGGAERTASSGRVSSRREDTDTPSIRTERGGAGRQEPSPRPEKPPPRPTEPVRGDEGDEDSGRAGDGPPEQDPVAG